MSKGNKTVKYVLNSYDESLNEEIDEVRSSKWTTACTTSNTSTAIYDVPTGKSFEVKTVILNSDATVSPQTLYFYDGTPTTTPVWKTTIGTQETLFITDVKGIYFNDYVYMVAGNASTAQVTLGGFLRDTRADGT